MQGEVKVSGEYGIFNIASESGRVGEHYPIPFNTLPSCLVLVLHTKKS